jgi:hypothetical protein
MLPMIEPGPRALPLVGPSRAEVRVDPRRENRLVARETRRFIAVRRSSERFTPCLKIVRAGPVAAEKLPEHFAGVRVAVQNAHAARESRGLRVHKDARLCHEVVRNAIVGAAKEELERGRSKATMQHETNARFDERSDADRDRHQA